MVQDVGDLLRSRTPGPRDEEKDNKIFGSLTQLTVDAIQRGQIQFAISLFDECFELARQYESESTTEVHKGAITFNVALAYLHANDFPAAMHYLQLAQVETRKTRGDNGWGIFDSDLFRRNFWEALDRFEQESPLGLYDELWLTPFGSSAALNDWKSLSDSSRLLYIVVNAERISYWRLRPQPDLPVSQSFSLSYWNLIADLSRVLETEFRQRGLISGTEGLLAGVLQKINGPISNFRQLADSHYAGRRVDSPTDFNAHFSYYQQAVRDVGGARGSRIAAAAVLAGVTRNQVQHQVDPAMVTFTDWKAAQFTVDVLLSLCRLDQWVQS